MREFRDVVVPTGVAVPDVPLPLVGGSDAAARGRQALSAAANSRTPVLITAEAGCRPSALAEWLHARGPAGGRLIAIDCASGDPAAIDRRAFGATPRRGPQDLESIGADAALLAAGAGTVFLENVEDLPASAQRRLNRILRDGEARAAGRQQPVAIACRVVASTTHDLDADVREGGFRDDLHRRLASSRIAVPALRQRPANLSAIVSRLLVDLQGGERAFTQPAVTVLAALGWPQNLDELAAVLTKVMATAGPTIRQEDVLMHLPIEGALPRVDLTTSLRDARRRFERDYIAAVLDRHHWRMSDAAAALGIERANLYRKTRQLGIVRMPPAELS